MMILVRATDEGLDYSSGRSGFAALCRLAVKDRGTPM